MKKSLCIFIIHCLFALHSLYAQTDTLLCDENGSFINTPNACCYCVRSRADSLLYVFKVFASDGKLKKVFHSFSKQASVLQGGYLESDSLGSMLAEGEYDKGFKHAEWKFFYLQKGGLKEKRQYYAPNEYYSRQYDSTTKKLIAEGAIDKFGKKTGIWKQYHENSERVSTITNYQIGKKEGLQTEFYLDGSIKRLEYYERNKIQKGELFDPMGNKLKYYPAFCYPQYREYVSNYLQKNVSCVAEALRKADFQIVLSISKEGVVTDAIVKNVDSEQCTQKIKETLLKMKKWKPALWENKPVKYTYETTIRLYIPRD